MNTTRLENYGWTLAAIGGFIAIFSHWVVFFGLQSVFGIDSLVGMESFLHPSNSDLGYQPEASLFGLVALMAAFGLAVAAIGAVLVFKVRADLRLFAKRFTTTTPFTLAATLSIVHAAAPIAYTTLMGIARHTGWKSASPLTGIGTMFWAGIVLTWPLWYAVVPQANRRHGFSPVIPLVVGTIIWGLSALPMAGLILMLLLWRGC